MYITQLDFDTRANALNTFCGRWGEVRSVSIHPNAKLMHGRPQGSSSGRATVEFKDKTSAVSLLGYAGQTGVVAAPGIGYRGSMRWVVHTRAHTHTHTHTHTLALSHALLLLAPSRTCRVKPAQPVRGQGGGGRAEKHIFPASSMAVGSLVGDAFVSEHQLEHSRMRVRVGSR